MAEQPNVIITSPQLSTSSCAEYGAKLDGVFGRSIVTTYDLNETSTRMILDIRTGTTSADTISQIRQYPNNEGYCHFDISKVVKNYMYYDKDYWIYTGQTYTSHIGTTGENTRFIYLYSGYEATSLNPVIIQTGYTQPVQYIPARKRYDELVLDWDRQKIGGVLTDNGTDFTGLTITSKSEAFTDFNYVNDIKIRNDEEYTLTFSTTMQSSNPDVCSCPLNENIVANYVRVDYYSNDTLVDTDYLYLGTGLLIGYANIDCGSIPDLRSVCVGRSNTTISTSISTNNADRYEVTLVYSNLSHTLENELSNTYNFIVTGAECNDHEEPIRFSWINSLGFRDYFTFTKRQDYNINISREEYLRDPGTWNSSIFNINTLDRGYTQFSGKLEERFKVFSDYITDSEAEFLKNLFISPQVEAKIDGEWLPINITNTSYIERNFRKDKFFQYEIDFKLAHNLNTQIL